MKILVHILLASVFIVLFKFCSSHQPQTEIIDVKEGIGPGGIWKSKTQWKAHWVKHWEVRKVYVPIWKKVWAPVEIKEWIPLPQPPPTDWTTPQPNH